MQSSMLTLRRFSDLTLLPFGRGPNRTKRRMKGAEGGAGSVNMMGTGRERVVSRGKFRKNGLRSLGSSLMS